MFLLLEINSALIVIIQIKINNKAAMDHSNISRNLSVNAEMSEVNMIMGLKEKLHSMTMLDPQDKHSLERLRSIIQESDEFLEDAVPQELIVDAQILNDGSKIVRTHASTLNSKHTAFAVEDYVNGVNSFVNNNGSNTSADWDQLAIETFKMFLKSPPLTYKLGTFVMEPAPSPKNRKRVRREPLKESQKITAELVETSSSEQTEISGIEYRHILKCLLENYKKENRKAISFLRFITDPGDYWKTVENIFHFAFLVRDGKVRVFLNEQGLPYIEPVLEKCSSEQQTNNQTCQFTFRISLYEWKEIVNQLKIKTPLITHIKK